MGRLFAVAMIWLCISSGAFGQRRLSGAEACERVAKMALPGAKVTSAERVEPGAFTPTTAVAPWLAGDAALYKALPAFCRVTVEATPSTDSDIKIEVWLPVEHWNGKFQGRGNGGFAGEIDFRALALAVHEGYATAATDTGHAAGGTDARWALGHSEKITDFAYRAIHEMTTAAKLVIQEFYGKHQPLQHSYFASCSNGGRQALMEAQRYPADYDGIVAGAPANYWTHLVGSAIWDAQATTREPGSYIPASKLPMIAKAVNDACDAQDGVSDGILNDPRKCHFDPATIVCQSGDAETCLTQPQAAALKKLYEGAQDSDGKQLFPGYLPGAEEGPGGWGLWITGQEPGKSLLFAFGYGFFADMVYENAGWSYKQADVGEAIAAADSKLAKTLNAKDPNLAPFQARGGKLIVYHGWNDPAISAVNTINYYNSVVSTMGQKDVDSFARLYMAPGMQHCGGGPGPDSFGQEGPSPFEKDAKSSLQLAVEQWVEKGVAPSEIVAKKLSGPFGSGEVKMTRPLCVYPMTAKYKGAGDVNEAGSFVCGTEEVKK